MITNEELDMWHMKFMSINARVTAIERVIGENIEGGNEKIIKAYDALCSDEPEVFRLEKKGYRINEDAEVCVNCKHVTPRYHDGGYDCVHPEMICVTTHPNGTCDAWEKSE